MTLHHSILTYLLTFLQKLSTLMVFTPWYAVIVMSHDSAKHKQNGVNYIRSESSNRLVPVALYGQVIEWSQNSLYIMTRSHWVTGPESHYSDTRPKPLITTDLKSILVDD